VAGAARVVVTDLSPVRREMAPGMGADEVADPSRTT
jgi:threonine dehydrogenase-like Zn-dependent dehydrogenase